MRRTLELTEIFLFIGFFSAGSAATTGLIQFGGYVGLVTALVAWYASAAAGQLSPDRFDAGDRAGAARSPASCLPA